MQIPKNCSDMLAASEVLRRRLEMSGVVEKFSTGDVLFRAGDKNKGLFLVSEGEVRLGVDNSPDFDRVFASGSLLGLPSTFVDKPYSLTATADVRCELVHVPRSVFLKIMSTNVDLCQEASEMLCRELSFIHAALAQQKRQTIQAS